MRTTFLVGRGAYGEVGSFSAQGRRPRLLCKGKPLTLRNSLLIRLRGRGWPLGVILQADGSENPLHGGAVTVG